MTIIEKIRMISREKDYPISKLEADCGFSNGYLNPKRMKNIPSDRLALVAEKLEVSVEDLLTTEKTAPISQDGLTEAQKKLIAAIPNLPDDIVSYLQQQADTLTAFRNSQGWK